MTIWAHRRLFATALLAAAACTDDAATTTAPRPRVSAATEVARVRTGADLPTAPAATPAISAVTALTALAPRWGAPDGTAELVAIATVPVAGGDVVRVAQRVDGIEVDRSEVRALIGSGGALLAAAGELVPADLPRDRDGFRIDARTAVARAVDGPGAALVERPGATVDEAWYRGAAGDVVIERARARRRWHRDGDALVPVWVVEVFAGATDSTDSTAERVVLAARDGAVLARRDLTVDAFGYRVWADPDGRPLDGPIADYTPHPTGVTGSGRPPFIAPSLLSIDGLNHPGGSGTPDPWLNPGAGDTFGNNVDAYSDITSPDGFTVGDFRASTTAAGVFDRTYDTAADALVSTDQQQAAIAQLFYTINWLHDDWYDAGFTEAAGNAQGDNLGRGGAGGDVFLAEAQDSANDGARNNANMSTPADGMSPRMQVYLWSGVDERSVVFTPTLGVSTPRGAGFGPRAYDLTAPVRAASDGTGTSPDDGCEPFTTNVTGAIALVNRGNCTGEQKAVNAQAAGAVGLLIGHNISGSPAPGLPNDTNIPDSVTIATMSMSNVDGLALRAALGDGAVTATLHRRLGPEFDAALDAVVVAHEFGHYLHHRLSDCGSVMCSAQSEGWGDFVGLLTASRASDNLDGSYAVGIAASNGDPYFGIRRAPYSTDPSKNAFRFSMVAEGVDLPTSHPLAFAGSNSEVHSAGEVWAVALWEAYVALQKARGSASFDDTRRKMQRYVVAGLLLSPTDASFTETRSAILAAARAASPADAAVLASAFAVRGLGSCAISPPKDSTEFIGATDSFETRGNAAATSAELVIDVKDCDGDGALDRGETATVTIPVVNVGSDTLSGVEVTATSTTAGVVVTGGPNVLGTLAPDAGGTATFQVTLDSATGPAAATVDVTITSPGGCSETRQIVLPVRLEADDQRLASATDHFDALTSPWNPIGDFGDRAWTLQATTALDHYWNGADLGTVSDSALESPALEAGSGNVTVAFDHSYQFEFSNDTFFDGGMIEVTTDNGANWRDVSELATVPYDGLLGIDSGNPLGDRMAFGDRNPSFPATDRLVLDFGNRLAGQTFKLRFRIGTDQSVGGEGWSIDELVVTGITNKPFPEVIADAGACEADDGGDDGGCCSTGSGPGASIAAGAVVAALVRRRRRGAKVA